MLKVFLNIFGILQVPCVNGKTYWQNPNSITEEMQREGNSDFFGRLYSYFSKLRKYAADNI